jgi:hypothetical protein
LVGEFSEGVRTTENNGGVEMAEFSTLGHLELILAGKAVLEPKRGGSG